MSLQSKVASKIIPKKRQLNTLQESSTCLCLPALCVCIDANHKALQAPFWCLNYDRCSAMPQLKEWRHTAFIFQAQNYPYCNTTNYRYYAQITAVTCKGLHNKQWLIWCNIFALSKTVTARPKLKTLKFGYYSSRRFPSENGKKITWTARKTTPTISTSLTFKKLLFFRIKETVFASRWFWNHLQNSWYRSQTDLNSATKKSKRLLKTISRIKKSAPSHDHTFPSYLLERCYFL